MNDGGLCGCDIGWVNTAGKKSPVGCTRPTGETRPLGRMFLVVNASLEKNTHCVLMWIHKDSESVFSTLVKNANQIVHIFIIVLSTVNRI